MLREDTVFSNKKFCMWRIESSDGYMLMRRDGHPRATKGTPYVFEHVLIMEKYLGRYIGSDEVVHHINEDKKDNRISNLQLMTHSEHRSHHNKGNQIRLNQHIDTSNRVCYRCKSNKTTIHPPDKNRKTSYPMWYHLPEDTGNWYCRKCWRKEKYGKKGSE